MRFSVFLGVLNRICVFLYMRGDHLLAGVGLCFLDESCVFIRECVANVIGMLKTSPRCGKMDCAK